jgi:hypothetical protein
MSRGINVQSSGNLKLWVQGYLTHNYQVRELCRRWPLCQLFGLAGKAEIHKRKPKFLSSLLIINN